jgi:hypothetical protein
MRPLLLLLLGAISAFSQPFSYGAKLGVPLTDFVSVAGSASPSGFLDYATHTNRYILGATGELRLPFGLGFELDVLYRHIDYQSTAQTVGANPATTSAATTGNSWEFPLLAKYRFKTKVLHPYVDGGAAWDTLQGLTETVKSVVEGATNSTTSTSSTPSELQNSSTRGFVLGGGLDFKFLVIHIQPEVRFTRWGAKQFLNPSALLHSNQNQGEFLLGITF